MSPKLDLLGLWKRVGAGSYNNFTNINFNIAMLGEQLAYLKMWKQDKIQQLRRSSGGEAVQY